MSDPELSNNQLLALINKRFDSLDIRFDGLEKGHIGLREMVKGIADTVTIITDNMVTHDDLRQAEVVSYGKITFLKQKS